MTLAVGSEQQRLAALAGRWRTVGRTIGTPGALIDAVDTYEWLAGGFALLHTVDARVGDEHVQGAEIIGWDSVSRSYITLYCGNDGPNRYEASLTEEDGGLVWRMRSATDRFTGRFSDDGNVIVGRWEQLDEEKRWQPWMEVTLTKAAS
jgi:Protein of unknown function (DUF1579)